MSFNAFGEEEMPCETCGTLTTKTGTKRCDACWEVEHRLFEYLSKGGDKARRFVASALCIEEAKQPRNIVQLIPAGEHLFCMCDDGTAWELVFNPIGRRSWQPLPKPGLPTPLPKGWENYAKDTER